MAEEAQQDTLVIIKPDSFWRGLQSPVEARLQALGLKLVAACTLIEGANLPEAKWREFYFPSIGNRPACLDGTAKYMAHGPVQAMRLRGPNAIARVRQTVGATRPWQAEKGTIRGDFWPGADEANAPFRARFQQPGDEQFLFNMIHASDSEASFAREVRFFAPLLQADAGAGLTGVPEGRNAVTPYLKLPAAGALVEFLKQAFGAQERGRLLRPDGSLLHSEIVIGDSLVMVHAAPTDWTVKPSTLYYYVPDVDAVYQRAVAAGGMSVSEPADMYYGDRVACVRDVAGNDWWIASRQENASLAELQARANAFLKA